MGLNTIDLQPFLEGSISSAEQQALANSFKELSATWGFFYVKGYESMVPKELVDRVFDYVGLLLCSGTPPELTVAFRWRQNARFFSLPQEVKDRLAFTSSKANRGYLAQGREQPSLSKDEAEIAREREESGDQKEVSARSSRRERDEGGHG